MSASWNADSIRPLIDALRGTTAITALTGAGVSAASGIPTFRGADGLYKNVNALSLATPEAFERDPRFVWEWYDWRRQKIQSARPNAAHEVLAAWTRARPGVTVITQNVDGLHEKAGTERLIRLHGSIWHVRCWNRCGVEPRGWRDETVPFLSLPPLCRHCGGLVRPGVVWFGETLDYEDVAAASAATHCDVFLTIGTSAVVHPAAGLVDQARRHGAMTVEINPEATEASDQVDISIRGKAEEVLAAVARLGS